MFLLNAALPREFQGIICRGRNISPHIALCGDKIKKMFANINHALVAYSSEGKFATVERHRRQDPVRSQPMSHRGGKIRSSNFVPT